MDNKTSLELENTTFPSISRQSYKISSADTTWVAVSTCLVFIMIPGLGYFYGGITHRKNLLTTLLSTMLSLGIVSIQWFIWGYSLSFAEDGSVFIGNLKHAFFMGVGDKPHSNAPTIPSNLFMLFQGMFAAITPCLAFGSAAERTTIPAFLIFLTLWTTLVYDFVTYWSWAPNGWLKNLGVLDYAGGTPVHITSGFSALAYALSVGPRRTVDHKKYKPSNVSDVFLGTALLWFGWFGFNGGSEVSINSRAINAMIVSNISGSFGGLSWMVTDMIYNRSRKMSLNGFCCGAIAGLVVVTPACGFISPYYAPIFGALGGTTCYFACFIEKLSKYRYDDACDVFAVHGVGGVLGCFLTGIFAEKKISTMAGGLEINGGWVEQNWIQPLIQLVSIAVPALWALVFTFAILYLIKIIPFMSLKLTVEEEKIGGDWVMLGEVAYGHDLGKIHMSDFQKPEHISYI